MLESELDPEFLDLWTHAWFSRSRVSRGSVFSSHVMEHGFMISPCCDRYKAHTRAVGTVHLKQWKTKAGPASQGSAERVASHTCSERSSEKQKSLSHPYLAIQRTGAIAGPIFTQAPCAGLVSPPPRNVSISPLAAWRPQAFMEPNLGTRLSVSSTSPHSPVSLGSAPSAPPGTQNLSQCKLYSQGRPTCEQWGDTLLCSMGNSDCAFQK